MESGGEREVGWEGGGGGGGGGGWEDGEWRCEGSMMGRREGGIYRRGDVR